MTPDTAHCSSHCEPLDSQETKVDDESDRCLPTIHPDVAAAQTTTLSGTSPEIQENGAANLEPVSSTPALPLLFAMWPTASAHHQLGVHKKAVGFRNVSVKSLADAQATALRLSAEGNDVFHACAEYETSGSRTSANALAASAFWMDIDVGIGKEAKRKGYETISDARSGLSKFMQLARLPAHTHLVSSGGGLHVYWMVDRPIARVPWIATAKKLKALTEKLAFHADPTRTADIASVLRVPGTMNHKYTPPRPVLLLESNDKPLYCESFLTCIDAAYIAHVPAEGVPAEQVHAPGEKAKGDYGPPNIPRLRSALKCVDPDCSEEDWKLRVLAPLAGAAREHPDLGDELEELAVEFSRGDLWGEPCMAWSMASSSNGLTGEQAFAKAWPRFLRERPNGPRASIGAIYHWARQAGWHDDGLYEFETCETETVAPTPRAMPPNTADSLTGPSSSPDPIEAEKQQGAATAQIIPGRAMQALDNTSQVEREVAPTHHAYASDVIHRLTYEGWRPVHHEETLFVFKPDKKIWVPLNEGELQRFVAEAHDGKPGCKRRADYNGIAQHARALASNDTFFENAPVGMACPDGFYRVVGGIASVEPLSPGHRQRILLSFSPRPEPTPLFDEFLHATFRSSNQGEEDEQISLVQEIAGSCMLGLMHRHHKAALFYDPYGRAGKGTLETILRQLVPPPFVTAVSPFDWSHEYFLAKLIGARLNVVGELEEEKSIPAAIFKSVLGGDLLMGRHPMQRPVTFKNEAAHLFLSNHLIHSRDQSEAFFARWLIVEFPNSRLRDGLPLDTTLASRIVERELPGIAQWALEGARRLLDNKSFSRSQAHERLMEKWRRGNSSLIECLHETCVFGDDLHTRCSDLYRGYVDWCAENGRKPFAKSRVRDLLAFNVPLGVKLASLHGNDIYRGLSIKSPAIDL